MLSACDAGGCGQASAVLCGAGAQHVKVGSAPFTAIGGDLDFGGPDRPWSSRAVEPVKPPEVPPTESEGEVDEWLDIGAGGQPTNEAVARAVVRNIYKKLAGQIHNSRSATCIVRECSTFSDPTLRRGVPLSVALAECGRIFASSGGSAQTFDLSKPVGGLDYFISHNWNTGRFSKFLALAHHFNSHLAVAVAAVGLALACALEIGGALQRENAWVCTILPYLLVLFSIRDTCRFAFLDKACIHQSDRVLQRRGIEELSAFLCCSREMVVVYTDAYLSRLWTVYELASMILLQPSARITVIPVSLVTRLHKFVLFGLIPSKLVWSLAVVCFPAQIEGSALTLAALLLTSGSVVLLGIVLLRGWAREQSAMQLKVRQFKIREAVCAVESDRQLVYANVSAMMRVKKLVPADSDDAACLDAFDRMVAEVVPTHLSASAGLVGMGWRFTAAAVVLMGEPGFGTDPGQLPSATEAAFFVVATAAGALAWTPLTLDCAIWLTRKRLDFRGPKEWAWVAALFIGVWIAMNCFGHMHWSLQEYVLPHPDLGWLAILVLPCIALAGSIAVYRPCRRHRRLPKGDAGG